MKGLRVTKIVKETKFEVVWGKLEPKIIFPETKYSQNMFSCFHVKERTTVKVKFLFFKSFFFSVNKIFILAGGLGTRLLFYEV